MKKLLLIPIAIEIFFVIFGFRSIAARNQIVPVTEAQSIYAPAVDTSSRDTSFLPGPQTPSLTPEAIIQLPETISQVSTPIPIALSTPALILTSQPTVVPTIAATKVSAAIISTPSGERATFEQFLKSVAGKNSNQVTGVYVPEHFALPVLQQPAGNAGFVATQDQTVTQFSTPKAYGTTGFLAHNFLSGKKFFDLHIGNEVFVVHGNGQQEKYRIAKIERYQALSPESPTSNFIDLADPKKTVVSVNQVFEKIYTQPNRVVFQTCIEANGNASWGRIFVIAEKIEQLPAELQGLN
jgi:hypothetical protein